MATLAAPLNEAPSSRGPTAALLRKLFGRKIVLVGGRYLLPDETP